MSPAYLSQKLAQPLPIKDGGTLRTIRESCTYMTGMGKKRELLNHWQRVAKLILAKQDVLNVSRHLNSHCSWTPSWTYRKRRQNEDPQ